MQNLLRDITFNSFGVTYRIRLTSEARQGRLTVFAKKIFAPDEKRIIMAIPQVEKKLEFTVFAVTTNFGKNHTASIMLGEQEVYTKDTFADRFSGNLEDFADRTAVEFAQRLRKLI